MHAHDRPMTPPSAAVKALKTVLTTKPQTPRFDPQVHISNGKMDADTKEEKEDSFVERIESRTPATMTQTELCEETQAEDVPTKDTQTDGDTDTQAKKDESFIEQIITRSPAKPMIRIEDSVEAIDALEEAIEKIGESIPAAVEEHRSPAKVKEQSTKIQNSARKHTSRATLTPGKTHHGRKLLEDTRSAQKSATASKDKASVTPRPTNGLAPESIKPAFKRSTRPSTIVPSTSTVNSSKQANLAESATNPGNTSKTSTHTNRIASNMVAKRVSSITKAPFVPIKSTKPPTRSSFVLPGEAIAQKLKQQREDRIRSEEENKRPARTFKARPAPAFTAPVVKPTTASKARMSIAKNDATEKFPALAKGHAPIIKPLRRQSSVEAIKRLSTLKVIKKNTPAVANAYATRKSIVNKVSSPDDVAPPPSATRQTSRGKEVFQRSRLEKEEKDRVQKEKEAAARKARVDAAERGRIASREWAEKQKAKRLSAQKGAASEETGASAVA